MALASQLFLQPGTVQYYTYSNAYLKFSSVLISPARWRWPVSCSSSQVEVSQSAACGSSSPPCTDHLDAHCKVFSFFLLHFQVTVYLSLFTLGVFTVYLTNCDESLQCLYLAADVYHPLHAPADRLLHIQRIPQWLNRVNNRHGMLKTRETAWVT